MKGHYLTHPALTNIPVNHKMLGNSDWFLSVSFYPNMPHRCSLLCRLLGFPVGVLALKQQRQVKSGAPSELRVNKDPTQGPLPHSLGQGKHK